MGLECTKSPQKPREYHDSRKMEAIEHEIRRINDLTTFNIKIDDLRLLNFSQTFHMIRIEIPSDVAADFHSQEFSKKQKIWITEKQFKASITAPLADIAQKVVLISILDKQGNILDQLKMKLYHLSTGPVKHDHLLQNLKSRLLFSFHIDQSVQLGITLKDFSLSWKDPSVQVESSYLLALILSHQKENIYMSKRFQKHWKIKDFSSEKISIRNTKLNDSIIRIKLTLTDQPEHHLEFYIPYPKIVELSSYRQISTENGVYQTREISRNQDIIINGEVVGNVTYTLSLLKSRLYVEQMDCVIFSEHGIVLTTASDYHDKEEQLNGQTIRRFLLKLKKANNQGISDYQFYKTLEQLHKMVVEGTEFQVNDDFFQVQSLVLDLAFQLQEALEEDELLKNEYIWKILNLLLHKKLMNLRYFGSIRDSSLQKQYALKYYKFLINTLIKIVQFILHGINYKELSSLQKFVAYAYFRFSWCQNEIIEALLKKTDPVLSEDKIVEIGASMRGRSPSKSYFYDWETNVLSLIKKEEEYQALMLQLQKTTKDNPRWAALLFDREYEQLFYGLYSELWDQASIFLWNNGRIMWEYFPRYPDLLSIFLGEMNDSAILDFSEQMTLCNMKLIKNEKLLNTFMMLIFPKTCLYETYSVMKCLDMISCYFKVILDHGRKIPQDFHYNYFYTGVRCILESNHSVLIQIILTMLYKYYNIFTKEFKETLNHYIICHVFNSLFMHWSQPVRNIFHLLVAHRIEKFKENDNPEQVYKNFHNPPSHNYNHMHKVIVGHHHEQREAGDIVLEIVNTLKDVQSEIEKPKRKERSEYYLRMRSKLPEKHREKKIRKNNISTHSCIMDTPCKIRLNSEDNIQSPVVVRRKWSLAGNYNEDHPTPTQSELKYLTISLKEYEESKKETKPDEMVEERSKMLQLNVDQ